MRLAQISGVSGTASIDFYNYQNFIGLFLSKLLRYAVYVAGFYFTVQIVLAGFTLLTSVGAPEKIKSASQTIVNSLIGLIIVVSVYFIMQALQTILGLQIIT